MKLNGIVQLVALSEGLCFVKHNAFSSSVVRILTHSSLALQRRDHCVFDTDVRPLLRVRFSRVRVDKVNTIGNILCINTFLREYYLPKKLVLWLLTINIDAS
jgi:hypothetical protein